MAVYFASTGSVLDAFDIDVTKSTEYLIERDASNVIRLYINGFYHDKVTNSSGINMEGILIGSSQTQSSTWCDWNGYIDEFIWMPDLSSPYSATPFAGGVETY